VVIFIASGLRRHHWSAEWHRHYDASESYHHQHCCECCFPTGRQ